MYGKKPNILKSLDWVTILLYLALLALGWMSVCGATYDFSQEGDFFDLSTRSGMQIMWIGTSILLAGAILLLDEGLFDTFANLVFLAFLILLAVTPFLAHDIKGSMSWIKIGGFSIQPAEFAKFATALALAKLIGTYGFAMKNARDFLSCLFVILTPMLLIVLQKETGSALVYLAFFLVLYREGMTGSILFLGVSAVTYFVVGVRFDGVLIPGTPISVGMVAVFTLIALFTAGLYYVFGRQLTPGYATRRALIALFAVGSVAFYFATDVVMDHLKDHQRTRIEVLLGLKDDPKGAGYNVRQAQIAIGSGGLQGKGFLMGTQTKLKYVPEQETDFIFCTVGEEEGFLGAAGVLVIYLLFILRLIHVSERQPDTFARVYGYCVLSIFLFHVFINVGMVLGLTPVIGIPLPFFSYGGSSLWGFTILLFIFLKLDSARELKQR